MCALSRAYLLKTNERILGVIFLKKKKNQPNPHFLKKKLSIRIGRSFVIYDFFTKTDI